MLDEAMRLFEAGRVDEAAGALAFSRRLAVTGGNEERLTEIDGVIEQMQAHLSGKDREAFISALAYESASTQPHKPIPGTGHPLDEARRLLDDGRVEDAARRLAIARRLASSDAGRLAEINEAVARMQSRLTGEERAVFEQTLAEQVTPSQLAQPRSRWLRRVERRSIVESVGVVASAGAIVILVSALFHFWWFSGTPCKDVGIYTIRADGGGRHRIRPERRYENPFFVTWIDGGRRLAVEVDTWNTYPLEFNTPWRSMNADGSDVRPLPGPGPNSSAGGTRLVLDTFYRRGLGFRFIRRGQLRTVAGAGGPQLSPDGRFIAYVNGNPARIYVLSTESGSLRRLPQSSEFPDELAPTWSPDGRKLAFLRTEQGGSEGALYVMNADGSDQRLIAHIATRRAQARLRERTMLARLPSRASPQRCP